MKLKLLIVVAVVTCGLFTSAIVPEVNAAKERLILNAVINYLDALHIKPAALNDEFSEEAFNNYIEMVDPAKRFLLQSEVDELSRFKFDLDEQVNTRTFDFFDASEGIINEAHARTKAIYNEIIEGDFHTVSALDIEMDADKRNHPQSEEELKELWKKILKYDFNNRLKSKIESQSNDSEDEVDFQDDSEQIEEIKQDAEETETEVVEKKTVEELKAEVLEDIKKSYKNWFDVMDKERRSDKFDYYINAFTKLYDPHSAYLSPKDKEDFDIRMGGKLEGIGARLTTENGMTKVISVIPGGPAWKGKELEVDDYITAVKQEGENPLNIVGMRLDDVVQKIRGDKGTIVVLTVKKKDGTMTEIQIERDEVIIDEAFARSLILDIPNSIDQVGYISLPKFYSSFEKEDGNSCAEDVKVEIEKLNAENVSGIILDIRGNGGGSLKDVIDMSGLFIKDGPIVQVKPKAKDAFVYNDEDPQVHYQGPLIVMVNEFSASASEILAAALQDYDRAVIVGSHSTFGKGTVQRFIDLDRAYNAYDELKPMGSLKVTMQKFYRVNGGSTQVKGVNSDIVLPDKYHYINTGESDYEHALEWTEIDAVEHSQDVYRVNNKSELAAMSAERIKNDPTFQLVLENAQRLKSNQDESVYPLDYDAFSALRDKRMEEAERFADIFDKDIPNMNAANLEIDMGYINLDESRVVRNDEWIKGVKRDVYIEECMYIMKDMIAVNKDIAENKKQ